MSDKNKYPLYPDLPDGGAEEAQDLVDRFRREITSAIKSAADDVMGSLYANIVPHIQSDSWTNFRNDMVDGLQDYRNRKLQGEYDFKKIRQTMFREHRAEIIDDLNQDMVKEIEELKEEIKWLKDRRF
jgi:hypothetical protein